MRALALASASVGKCLIAMHALLRGFGSLQPDFGVVHCRANAQQPKLFVGMILILIFAEALALYGLIGALLQ